MVAKEKFIHEHPEVIAAFIRGWLLDGTTRAVSNPMLAAKILQEEPDFESLGEETTRKLLAKVAFATLDDNARMFGLADGEPLFEPLFDEASHLWAKHGYITAPMPAEQAQDVRSLQEVYQALFVLWIYLLMYRDTENPDVFVSGVISCQLLISNAAFIVMEFGLLPPP
jgi:ABC-type nitrate/sulfonate/bicarbonate transport system substrate-binding protein